MNKLQKLVSKLNTDHVFIQTHNFPDPDAISSAFGLQYLLKIYGIDSTICYKGKVDRCNTRKMMEMFGISAINVDKLGESINGSKIILIDAQKDNGNTYDLECDEVISIDHHPIFDNVNYIYSDIRSNVGACASIIASYFIENEIDIPESVATALLYGIKVDTAKMTRGVSKLDMDMFYALFFKANNKQLAYLEANSLQLEDLKAYASAIDSIVVEDGISFANTGKDCPEALIAEVADFTAELQNVYFSVVYSIRKESIKFSVRSMRHSGCNAGEIIIEALEGLGTGGGHVTMAGGYVSLRDKTETAEKIVEKIIGNFKRIVGKKVNMYAQVV